MDYEKKYKEALERARIYRNNAKAVEEYSAVARYENIFPELRENEDEKIRKEIIEYLTVTRERDLVGHPERQRWITYLEKQKEQKHPNGCFTCDEYKKGYEAGRLNGFTAGYNKAMKEQKPAEWSEEDEKIIDTIVSVLGQYIDYKAVSGIGSGYATPRYSKEIDWLKSLRPSWKPSEEQMDALKELIDDANKAGWVTPGATELYEQLKKL